MDESQRTAPRDPNPSPRDDRLDSWKKIATYLKRDVSTVQRWERREGLPVHRHLHDKQGSVFAYRAELDTWWEGRRGRLPDGGQIAGQAATPRGGFSSRKWLPLVVLAVGGAGVLAWSIAHRPPPWRSPLEEARFSRLADFPGFVQAATISRDGRRIAFLGDRDGRTDVWVSELGSGVYGNLTRGEALELVNPSIRTLGFAPDSSLVAIWTRGSDGSKPGDVNIVAIPAGGGQMRSYLRGVAEFDWSHKGTLLVYHTTAPGDPLFVRANGTDHKIYSGPAGVHCHFPVWSANDDYVYFVRGVPPDDWDLWRVRPTGLQPERLTDQHARLSYPVVLDDNHLAYLATDADGSGPWMYVIDPRERHAHRIGSGLENFTSLAASADGRKLLATISTPRDSLWRLSAARGRADSAAAATPVKLVTNAATPRWAGSTLVYTSASGDTEGIWVKRGDTPREIWSSKRAHILSAPAVSDDAQRLAFATAENGKTVLNVVDLDGAHFRRIADSLELRGSAAWAADGLSLLWAVVRDGEPRLTRIFLDGQPPLPFLAEYSIDPVWSPDHRFVVYSGADIGTTFPLRAAAPDGRPHPIAGIMLTRGARRVAFYPNSESLLILDGEIGHKNFWVLDLATGAKQSLAQLPAEADVRDFDVAGATAEIVFDRVEASSEVAIIERAPP